MGMGPGRLSLPSIATALQQILFIGGGGGNSLRPYSQQRPTRTNLSCCLGLIDNGQYKSTNYDAVVELMVSYDCEFWVSFALGTLGICNPG